MKRLVVLILSVILALIVAAPLASAQAAATSQTNQTNLGALTTSWWDWAFATSPSPMQGDYSQSVPPGDMQCDGSNQSGVWFLSGADLFGGPGPVQRTCTVPANKPIFFPVFNIICSEAFGVAGQDPPDPTPYDTACAKPYTDATVDPPTKLYANLDGNKVDQQRVSSGVFQWTIAANDNPFGLYAGTYPAATDGVWVYLKNGLKAGQHTIKFGGTFKDTPFGDFEGTPITYKLAAQ